MALERTFSAARRLLAAIIVAWVSGVVFLFARSFTQKVRSHQKVPSNASPNIATKQTGRISFGRLRSPHMGAVKTAAFSSRPFSIKRGRSSPLRTTRQSGPQFPRSRFRFTLSVTLNGTQPSHLYGFSTCGARLSRTASSGFNISRCEYCFYYRRYSSVNTWCFYNVR